MGSDTILMRKNLEENIVSDPICFPSSSVGCIDIDSTISPGESVLIRKGDNEFKVLVNAVEDGHLNGTVLSIGPIPTIEAQGITRGQTITFNQINVYRVYRDDGVA